MNSFLKRPFVFWNLKTWHSRNIPTQREAILESCHSTGFNHEKTTWPSKTLWYGAWIIRLMWEVHHFRMGRFIHLDTEIIFSYCSNVDFSSFETKDVRGSQSENWKILSNKQSYKNSSGWYVAIYYLYTSIPNWLCISSC